MLTPVLLIGLIAGTDLCIKEEIEARDDSEFPKDPAWGKGLITIHKSHNKGFPFEVLKSRPELVKTIPMAIMCALGGVLGFLLPKKGYWAQKLVLVLTLGGALSNLYDRMTRNYVVDYFSINIGRLRKVVFNLGDLFIFAGAAAALLIQAVRDLGRLLKAVMEKK